MIDPKKIRLFEEEWELIDAVLDRAEEIRLLRDTAISRQAMKDALVIAYGNDPSIKLDVLRDCAEEDFWHDVWGIYANLNRATGKMRDFFVPRCCKSSGKQKTA